MSRVHRTIAWARARPGVIAIVMLGIVWGSVMHQMGWAQLAHFSEVRAMADGRKNIDPWHWETGDVAYINGHFYSVKSPGTAALATPLYMAIREVGGLSLADDAAQNAAQADVPRWAPDQPPPWAQYGYSQSRALTMETRIEDETPVVWALTLLVAVIPSILLLLGVRRIAERMVPGYGTAAAITLGAGTIMMVFAAEFFSHALSTTLGFAAFAVLMRERAGPGKAWLLAAAGLLAGLAVSVEVQLGLMGIVLGGYAITRGDALGVAAVIRRGLAYGAGALAGAAPMLAFNSWMLGSPLKLGYADAVSVIGTSGHDQIGLNDAGFFGITTPTPSKAIDLLLGGRGLLILTPILVMALIGVVLMHRRGHRAEAWTIAAAVGAYFLYDSAYWQPYGGGTPGPRFLMPIMPFLALGLAFAWRRLPATTLALAVPSILWMLLASITYPLLGEQGTQLWPEYLRDGRFEHTLLTVLGVHSGWLALIPVFLAFAAAIALTVRATPKPSLTSVDLRYAGIALAVWAVVSVVGPSITTDDVTPLNGGAGSITVVAICAVLAAFAVGVRYVAGGGGSAGARPRRLRRPSGLALGDSA